ncbi:probable peptide chain release factor C12orf65 homolog, mitochondrial isoform X2 [Acanthaster planci]|uniref:Probable peptide chain release factor C12orf65 homolog, mitochondrial isoform X2 n=1 Tax=Acanthaster planci TaxID=133434 RepID=A0A8B7YJA5_ACAPL|nr:probable peptide chain release factor C12orf65 homolog, mitochondrial isoform X2 [Acanthaster planci]
MACRKDAYPDILDFQSVSVQTIKQLTYAQAPSSKCTRLALTSNISFGTTCKKTVQHVRLSTTTRMGNFGGFYSACTANRSGWFPQLRLAGQSTMTSSRCLLQAPWPTMLNSVAASTTTTRDKTRTKLRKKLPELDETELEEMFVRGSGPGGQATNKTSNCVVLKHSPSGITVKCHQTRSLPENQKIARELMKERLDIHYHGEDSAVLQQKAAHRKKVSEKTRRTKVKLEKLKKMKEMLMEDKEV